MHTLTQTPDEPIKPLDLRTVPIWAIPQLAYIRDTLGATLLFYANDDVPTTESGVFTLSVPNEFGKYLGRIYKSDMLTPNHIPPMYNVS